jgi:hypothetical protein
MKNIGFTCKAEALLINILTTKAQGFSQSAL